MPIEDQDGIVNISQHVKEPRDAAPQVHFDIVPVVAQQFKYQDKSIDIDVLTV